MFIPQRQTICQYPLPDKLHPEIGCLLPRPIEILPKFSSRQPRRSCSYSDGVSTKRFTFSRLQYFCFSPFQSRFVSSCWNFCSSGNAVLNFHLPEAYGGWATLLSYDWSGMPSYYYIACVTGTVLLFIGLKRTGSHNDNDSTASKMSLKTAIDFFKSVTDIVITADYLLNSWYPEDNQ